MNRQGSSSSTQLILWSAPDANSPRRDRETPSQASKRALVRAPLRQHDLSLLEARLAVELNPNVATEALDGPVGENGDQGDELAPSPSAVTGTPTPEIAN